MSCFKVALVTIVLSISAVSATAQDLRSGLEAIKRGQWSVALQELGPLADSGSAQAQYALGTMYANGDGVGIDLSRAEKLLRQAALGGEWRARAHLEFMRVSGQLAPTAPGGTMSAAAATGTGGDGWRVQLATVPTPDLAQREFRRLSRQFGELLAGTDLLAPPFTMPDGAQVVRVQAGPLSETRARDICARLRDLNAGCRIIRPEG
jgi:TPR repeat protein